MNCEFEYYTDNDEYIYDCKIIFLTITQNHESWPKPQSTTFIIGRIYQCSNPNPLIELYKPLGAKAIKKIAKLTLALQHKDQE